MGRLNRFPTDCQVPGEPTVGRHPSLIRFLLINAGIGALVAIGVVAALILTDTHALGRLIMADRDPVVAVVLLAFGFVITLGSAAMGAAIMGLPYGEGGDRKGRRLARQAPEPELAPATVSARR